MFFDNFRTFYAVSSEYILNFKELEHALLTSKVHILRDINPTPRVLGEI